MQCPAPGSVPCPRTILLCPSWRPARAAGRKPQRTYFACPSFHRRDTETSNPIEPSVGNESISKQIRKSRRTLRRGHLAPRDSLVSRCDILRLLAQRRHDESESNNCTEAAGSL